MPNDAIDPINKYQAIGGTNTLPGDGGGLAEGDLGDIINTGGVLTFDPTRVSAAGIAMTSAANAAAQTALLDVFTSGLKGLAPASGGGTTNFLRADGQWAAPPGGGGGGSGDVVGPASSVDSEIALFDSTTGKAIKRASGTGFVLATSGVASFVSSTGSGNVVRATAPTLTAPNLAGEVTVDGAEVITNSAMGALAIDVTKRWNSKSVSADSTFTFSATPTTGAMFQLLLSNSDTASHVMTLPSVRSMLRQTDVTSFSIPAGWTVLLTFRYDGSIYRMWGEPALLFNAEATVASAGTTDLGALTSTNVSITGTTTITSFGSTPAGIYRQGRFTGALTLTHNATSLILPNGANMTTAAGDRFGAYSLGSGNWVVLWYTPAGKRPVYIGDNQNFTKAQAVTDVLLTDGANIAVDASLSNNFYVVLGGNRTLDNPTNPLNGQVINLRIRQDATGSRTLSWGTKYWFPGGTDLVVSTAANAVDLVSCKYDAVLDAWLCVGSKAFA